MVIPVMSGASLTSSVVAKPSADAVSLPEVLLAAVASEVLSLSAVLSETDVLSVWLSETSAADAVDVLLSETAEVPDADDVLLRAASNIKNGQVFDENLLMAIATIGAFAMIAFPEAEPSMAEGCAVMLFYQVGELFQAYAVGKSRRSITALMDIRPDYANIERDGKLVQVDPDEVQIGETIVVKPGERIPLDGTILKGLSLIHI